MALTITLDLRFEAAHKLPRTPPDHKCHRLHGHSYLCEVHVTGDVDPQNGWVRDFAEIENAFAPLLAELDHNYLNEILGLDNPTSENIVRYIWDHLAPELPGLSRLVLHETCTARCEYTGPE